MADAAPRGIKGYVKLRASGRLGGYAYDRGRPERVLQLEFLLGDRLVATRTCSGALPPSAPPGTPTCGFSLAPWEHRGAWFDQPLTIRVVGSKRTIGKRPFLMREQVRLVGVRRGIGRITVTLDAPAALHPLLSPSVLIDGQPVGAVRSSGASGLLHLHAPVALDDDADHEVVLAWADGEPLDGFPVIADVRPRPLSANPAFADWSGDRPAAWAVTVEGSALLRPGSAAVSSDVDAPVATLVIDPGHEPGSRVELAQEVALLDPAAGHEVELVARATVPTEVVVGASHAAGGLREMVALGPEWTSWHVPLPDDGGSGDRRLTLSTPGDTGLEIASFALGPCGFALPPEGIDPIADGQGPVVCHGDLADWPHGLVFRGDVRHREIARGWRLTCRPAMPDVQVSLATIERRDTATGAGSETSYALALEGTATGSWLRLEAELSKPALAAGRIERLALTLGTRSGQPARGGIGKIFVFEQTGGEDGEPASFATICQLAAMVPVPGAAQRLEWALPASRVGLMRLAAELALADPRKSFFLAFEFFPQTLDVVLADVSLGGAAPAAVTAVASGTTGGYLAFEDPAIRRQVARLRGLDSWASPMPVVPRTPVAAGRATAAPWRWDGFAPVDVVVPVYNAVDDVLACVHALERATAIPHRLVLVNDASGLATRVELEAFAATRPWVELITNEVNRGYTRTANIGLSRSKADWVVLLNSDTIVSTGWLAGLLACAASDPAIAAVGPLSNAASYQSVPALRDRRQRWMVNALPPGMTVDDMAELVRAESVAAYPRVPLLNGFCTLFRRSVLEELDFLDEVAFPVGYGEENDLCLRIGEAGHALAIADDVYVYHSKSASFGDARRTELARAGTAACLAKHPGVDLKEMEQQLIECVPLIELRRRLKATLAQRSARYAAGTDEVGAADGELAA